MNSVLKRLFALLGLVTLLLIPNSHALAASTQAIPTGVTVSPVIQQVQLQPGQTSTSFTALLTNNTKNPVTISMNSVDFVANGQLGGLSFLSKPSNDINIITHELASNLAFTPSQLSLAPATAQKVTITIQNADTLAAGGHYGAVIYHVVNDNSTSNTKGNRVSIQQAVSTLVFAITGGRGTQGVSLLKPNLPVVAFHFPQSVNVLFEATGNTQVTPRGTLGLSQQNGKIIGDSIINVNSGMILPGSTRLYNTPLPTTGISWWPGRYHIRISYRYDGQNTYKTYDASFLYINVWHILLTIIIIAVILWALIKLRRYYHYLYRLSRLEKVRNLGITKIQNIKNRPKKVKNAGVTPPEQIPEIVLPEQQTETEENSTQGIEPEVTQELTATQPEAVVSPTEEPAKISTKTTTKTSKKSKGKKSPAKPKKPTKSAGSAKPRKSAATAKTSGTAKPKSVAKKATSKPKKATKTAKSNAKPKKAAKKTS